MSNKCHACGRRPTACQCYAALSLRSDNLVGQPFDFRMGLTGRREHREAVMVTASAPSLPDDATKRLEYPMADGLLDYFPNALRSEEHTSELQSLMRISYAVFCLKKKKIKIIDILN